jgi:hypothetical protein
MEPDFSGWVTKAGIKCSDGRTIMKDAFAHQDSMRVPLVWSHSHNDSNNVLGHVILTNKEEGVWGDAFVNHDTPQGKNAAALVQHEDIDSFSIWANQLVEKSKQVFHGMIKEVSLVLAGANPGAKIEYIRVAHSDDPDDFTELNDEAIITTGEKLAIEHSDDAEDEADEVVEHAEGDSADSAGEGETIKDVYDSMPDKHKDVVHFMVGEALKAADTAAHSDEEDPEGDLSHKEGNEDMTRNVFEGSDTSNPAGHVLSHDDMKSIFAEAQKGGSLKGALEGYALAHGIDNIESLFPNFKDLSQTPQFIARRMEWVQDVMMDVSKSPFSRVRTRTADITFEDARARGYIKGNLKKEEFFPVAKRETGPTTVYKKQKLDRDDILDITDFDVVAWIRAEMRVMLDEELARAVLIGDGRPVEDPANPGNPNPDKIAAPSGASGNGIRPILDDHELYVVTETVSEADVSGNVNAVVDTVTSALQFYRGSGSPTLFTTLPQLTKMLLARDTLGRRIYRDKADLANAMGVDDIQTVEPMEAQCPDVLGIIVNLTDYTIGADQGGQVAMFDFFDIDYNQYKYLLETRVSGGLTKYRSAVVIRTTAVADDHVLVPTDPTFVESTGVVTIPTQTGVVYKNADTGATLTAGAQSAIAKGTEFNVVAEPASGYSLDSSVDSNWTFYRSNA